MHHPYFPENVTCSGFLFHLVWCVQAVWLVSDSSNSIGEA